MGKRGPKPTPTKTLKKRGSRRAEGRKGEPQPAPGEPIVPAWLSDDGKLCWQDHVGELSTLGIVTPRDSISYALLCQAYSDYIELLELVRKNGWTAVSEKGGEYQQPAVGAMNKAWDRVMKACREFGMTPSARAGMDIEPGEKPETGKGRFFKVVG